MLTTTAEDLGLKIAKLRAGSFFPGLLKRRRWVDQAFFAVVMEACVHGVPTRKVKVSSFVSSVMRVRRERTRISGLRYRRPFHLFVVLLGEDGADDAAMLQEWSSFRKHKEIDQVFRATRRISLNQGEGHALVKSVADAAQRLRAPGSAMRTAIG